MNEELEQVATDNIDNSALIQNLEDLAEAINTQIELDQLEKEEQLQLDLEQKEQLELDEQSLLEQQEISDLKHGELLEQLQQINDSLIDYHDKFEFLYDLLFWWGVVGLPLVIIVALFWAVYRTFMFTNW